MQPPKNITNSLAAIATQNIITRILTLGAQVALAWLLAPEDFGTYSIVLSLSILAESLKDGGVRDLVVQRQNPCPRFTSTAVATSVGLGAASATIIILIAFPAANIYSEEALFSLLCIAAIEPAINGCSNVHAGLLQKNMHFDRLAACEVAYTTAYAAIAIILAATDHGAASLVIPRPIAAAIRSTLQIFFSRMEISEQLILGSLSLREFRAIVSNGRFLVGTALMQRINSQADYAILGLFSSSKELGIYYLAFTISIQAAAVASTSLGSVFLAAFSKLNSDDALLRERYRQYTCLSLEVGFVLLAIQIGTASLLFEAMFSKEWSSSAPVMIVLTYGFAFRITGGLALSLLKAKGMYYNLFVISTISTAILFISIVISAYAFSTAIAMAWAVTFWSSLSGAFWIVYADNRISGSSKIFLPFIKPVVAGVVLSQSFLLISELMRNRIEISAIALLASAITETAIAAAYLYLFSAPVRSWANYRLKLLQKK